MQMHVAYLTYRVVFQNITSICAYDWTYVSWLQWISLFLNLLMSLDEIYVLLITYHAKYNRHLNI